MPYFSIRYTVDNRGTKTGSTRLIYVSNDAQAAEIADEHMFTMQRKVSGDVKHTVVEVGQY